MLKSNPIPLLTPLKGGGTKAAKIKPDNAA
jgi:hypothetical protein